jgi:hypothetical protein
MLKISLHYPCFRRQIFAILNQILLSLLTDVFVIHKSEERICSFRSDQVVFLLKLEEVQPLVPLLVVQWRCLVTSGRVDNGTECALTLKPGC